MPKEIERKYLLKSDDWKTLVSKSYSIQQGYLNSDPERTVRVRIKDDRGILTIKGKNEGITRAEYEYEIPIKEAEELIQLCELSIIKKVRNIVTLNSHIWEIDVFDGANKGLVLAEVELESEDTEILLPDWIGKEVSHDIRYYNSNLAKNPINPLRS